MQKHCVSCHAAGEVGPMPLTTYEEVSAYGDMIAYVTSRKLMPPWQADPSYSHFTNERVLSPEEIRTIRDWVVGELKPGALPYGMAISNVAGVTVYPREPDLILGVDTSFEQPGDYKDSYRLFKIPTKLDEDTWIEAIEFVPGNKQIVRHAAITVFPADAVHNAGLLDPGYAYFNMSDLGESTIHPLWYTWSPNQQTMYHSEGRGKFIPKNSELLLYVHYGPTNSTMRDSSTVQLHFASERIKQFITTVPLINSYNLPGDSIFIPAQEEKKFHASYTLPHDIELYIITPQSNLFCRKWEIFAMIPGGGDIIPLLKIDDWNFNWRQSFQFETPMLLPAGAVIHAIAHFDNTTKSPGNHDRSPVDIRLSYEQGGEMYSVFFEYTVHMPDVSSPVLVHTPSILTHDHLPVYLLPSKKGDYRFELVSMNDYNVYYNQAFTLGDVQQNIELALPSLPIGNYLLTIRNDETQIVSSHAFVKLSQNEK